MRYLSWKPLARLVLQQDERECTWRSGGTARNGEAAERCSGTLRSPSCGGLVEGAEQHEQQGWIEAQRRV